MEFAVCSGDNQDGERLAKMLLRRLDELCADVNVICFETTKALLGAFAARSIPILLLDAEMENGFGLKAARRVRELYPECQMIIFASDANHALRSYSVHPVEYMVKPFDYSILCRTLERCRQSWCAALRRVEVTVGRTEAKIPLEAIISAEISGRKLRIKTQSMTVEAGMSMTEFQRRVATEPFLRCHKSLVINMFHITSIQAEGFLMDDGVCVPVSIERRREVLGEYENFCKGRQNIYL